VGHHAVPNCCKLHILKSDLSILAHLKVIINFLVILKHCHISKRSNDFFVTLYIIHVI